MASKINRSLTLKQFMLRNQVLSLYRNLLRTIREVPGENNRKELHEWVRKDFRENRHHEDPDTIKVLLQHGKTFLEELQRSLSMSR